jgi:hypothetical protein
MDFNDVILTGVALLSSGVFTGIFYGTSERVHCFINRVAFRKAIIECTGVDFAQKNDVWRSPVYVNPRTGEIYAYRYPSCKIGKTQLRADGTGNYCGEIKWRRV